MKRANTGRHFWLLGRRRHARRCGCYIRGSGEVEHPRSIVIKTTKSLDLDTAPTEGREGLPSVDRKRRQRAIAIAHQKKAVELRGEENP